MDYICHRRRSNTAQRLDRLKKEKINQSRTKTIVWRCNSPTNSHSEEKLSQDSPTSTGENVDLAIENGAPPPNRKSKSPPTKSGLTRLLEKFPSLPKNPFDEFAQFDGGMSETVPVKKIMIFIAINNNQQHNNEFKSENKISEGNSQSINNHTISETTTIANNSNLTKDNNILPENSSTPQSPVNATNKTILQSKPKSNDPLEVVIVSTARVQDLIGLICWQYTNEGREPKLHPDINRFCLRIAEDNGEVDPDFTSLNPKEPLSKFNFPSLALTEKSEERVRSYNNQYANGNIYNHRLPTIAQNVITSSAKISSASSRFAALTRIIFKDAKLDTV